MAFREIITSCSKQLFVRPVMVSSLGLTAIGFGLGFSRAFTNGQEYTMKSYVDQNEVNMRSIHEREINSEFHLLLSTPPCNIPVTKRHIWQMAGEAEVIYDELNKLDVPTNAEEQKVYNTLYSQWLSQIYDIYFTMAEQRGFYTPEDRAYKQTRKYLLNSLPPAKPFTIRPFPDISMPYVDPSIVAPAPDAPREEFVKYYASKFNVDL